MLPPIKIPIGSTSATIIAVSTPRASDPAAIHIEAELGRALNKNGAGIGGAQGHDELKGSLFNEVVDDPALDLQRRRFEQEGNHRQAHQRDLVRPAYRDDIAEMVLGNRYATSGINRL